jgi:hypothetical protein
MGVRAGALPNGSSSAMRDEGMGHPQLRSSVAMRRP